MDLLTAPSCPSRRTILKKSYVACPFCGATVTPKVESRCPFCREVIQPGAAKCKHCGEALDPNLRAEQERRVMVAKAPEAQRTAEIRRKSSTFGGGCALQGVGLVCLVLAAATFFTIIGPIIFGFFGLWLIIYGARKAQWYACSSCGTELKGRRLSVCPRCSAQFTSCPGLFF